MTSTESNSKGPKAGSRIVRWMAILSLTGLFSILITPLGAGAITPTYDITIGVANSQHPVGSSTTVGVNVKLHSNSSNVNGVTVHFAITGLNSSLSGNATNPTNVNGNTSFTYTGTNPGEDSIVATVVPDASNSVSNTITNDYAKLTLSPATQTRAISQNAIIDVTLENGLSVNNVPIYYLVANSGSAPAIPKTATTSTNSSGQTQIVYTRSAGDNAIGTTDTVTVFADLNGGGTLNANQEPVATAQVTWGNDNINITSSISPINIGGQESITATVTNQSDNPVTGANVRFEVNSGVNSPPDGDSFTPSNGQATYKYTGTNPGVDTVTAYIDLNGNNALDSGEPSANVNITWLDISFVLTPSTQNASVGSQVALTGTVTDANDNGVSGERIRYSVSGPNSSVGGSVYTTSNGDGVFHYIGSHSGTDTVTAYVDLNQNNTKDSGEPSDTATVNWSTASLNLTPPTQTVTTNTPASLTASLSNSNVSVDGVVIRYTVTGANSASGTTTTDANGNATFSYTGTTAGTDTVTAYADYDNNGSQGSGEPSMTATVTWVLTATLNLSPTTTTPSVGIDFVQRSCVTTSDGGVPNVPIRYSVSGANSASGTMTTDGNGNTVISYTGTNSGADTLTAYADMNNNGSKDTGEPTASVTITWGGSTGGGTTPPPTTFAPAQPAAQKSGCMYFPATQHNLCAGFEAYWEKFGGLNIFGMPVTEEFQENGVTVQYFERARFEWHPGAWPAHYDVLLGLLGDEVTAGRTDTPFQATTANSSSDCTYFAQTSHNLCGTFKQYWDQFGGLAVYGYPISEAFQEKNPDTGQVYTVQYFERARMELQPGAWPAHLNVLLGRLGSQVLAMKYGAELY